MSDLIQFTDTAPAKPKGAVEGYLEDEAGLLAPPSLKIIQGTSKELEYGAKPGDIWSEKHNCVLPQPVTLVFLHMGISWTKFDDNFQLEWSTMNKDDPRVVEMGDEAYTVKTFRSIVLAPVNSPKHTASLLLFSTRGNAWNSIRQLYKKMRMTGLDAYGMAFHMSSPIVTAKNGKRIAVPDFGNPQFCPTAFVKELKGCFSDTAGQIEAMNNRQLSAGIDSE